MAKILVIDDDYRMRTLVKSILRRNRHEVFDEAEGKYGIEQASNSVPDLILLDIGLPDMDGLEVCRHLKANPKTRHIPIIMITGHGAADDVVKAYQSGADDYIVKPFETALLLAKATKHLGTKTMCVVKSGPAAMPEPELPPANPPAARPGEKPPAPGAKPAEGKNAPAATAPPVAANPPDAGTTGEKKKSLRSQVAERQKKRGGVL